MANPIKLKFTPVFDFTLIGIVTTEPIYRLGFLLNELFDYQLVLAPVVKIYHNKKMIIQDFDLFGCDEFNVELVANKGPHGLLVEEQKHIDFYLKVYNSAMDSKSMVSKIRGIKNISLVQLIEPDQLKSRNRLLFSIIED